MLSLSIKKQKSKEASGTMHMLTFAQKMAATYEFSKDEEYTYIKVIQSRIVSRQNHLYGKLASIPDWAEMYAQLHLNQAGVDFFDKVRRRRVPMHSAARRIGSLHRR